MNQDGVSSFDEVWSDDAVLNYNEGLTIERYELQVLQISNTLWILVLKIHFNPFCFVV